jgi:hypothetical protein
MAAPFEIICSPYTAWVGPVGTVFPVINVAPSASWTQLGTYGTKSMDEKGVTVTHDSTEGTFTPAGGTAIRKIWRTAEGLKIAFEIVDLTPEQYAKILGDQVVTTVTGPPATKDFQLLQGITVKTLALVLRGVSPVNDVLSAQYCVPMVYNAGNPAIVYAKASPSGLACEFAAIEDPTLGFGKYSAQTA